MCVPINKRQKYKQIQQQQNLCQLTVGERLMFDLCLFQYMIEYKNEIHFIKQKTANVISIAIIFAS